MRSYVPFPFEEGILAWVAQGLSDFVFEAGDPCLLLLVLRNEVILALAFRKPS